MINKENSLEVIYCGKIIFFSKGKWLYPLIELEAFLSDHNFDMNQITMEDKISGRAAAGFDIYLGIKKVNLDLVSDYAIDLYKKFNVDVHYKKRIKLIKCKTEELITEDMSPTQIHDFIINRALTDLG